MKYPLGKTRSRRGYIRYSLFALLFILLVWKWALVRSFVAPRIQDVGIGYDHIKDALIVVPTSLSTRVASNKQLADKNAQLEVTIEHLENELAARDSLLQQEKMCATSGVSAPVIVMSPLTEDITSLYSTLLLSKGYKDGIEEGLIVYVRGLQPVCTITQVYDQTSLCQLLTKSGVVTEATTASSSLLLSLTGNGGGEFVTTLPKEVAISLGNDVYLRSNPSMKLGTIVAIDKSVQDTSVTLHIRGAYNPSTSSLFYAHAQSSKK